MTRSFNIHVLIYVFILVVVIVVITRAAIARVASYRGGSSGSCGLRPTVDVAQIDDGRPTLNIAEIGHPTLNIAEIGHHRGSRRD
jgi:hypothetical protein